MRYPIHPVASLFPPMSEAELAALKADIAAQGLREPIVLVRGQVIDGRHRLRACAELGIEPVVREVDSDEPLALALSLNLHRRHLSEGQRAMIAAQLATLGPGRPAKTASQDAVSQEEAARQLEVSRRSVQRAKTVLEGGSHTLQQAVSEGHLPLTLASALAALPPTAQERLLERSPEELRALARVLKAHGEAGGAEKEALLHAFDQLIADHGLSGLEQLALVEAYRAEQPLPKRPSPAQARRIANEEHSWVLASDGHYHGPEGSADERAKSALWFALREGLERLAHIDAPIEELIAAVPAYQSANVTAWLARALALLTRFESLWKGAHHA